MQGRIVSLSTNSMHLLTAETLDERSNKPMGLMCDLDGNAIAIGDKPREVYLDNLTGDHFAKIMPSEVPAFQAKGTLIYSGVGEVPGYFVEAPDYTLNGRHGREDTPEEEQAAKVPVEAQQIHQQRPSFVKKPIAKKAAKKKGTIQ